MRYRIWETFIWKLQNVVTQRNNPGVPFWQGHESVYAKKYFLNHGDINLGQPFCQITDMFQNFISMLSVEVDFQNVPS